MTSSYNYIRDGVALTMNRLVGYLERQGVEVLVFAPVGPTPALAHCGTLVPVPSLSLPARPEYRLALGLWGEVRERLRAFRPDIVHVALAPDPLSYSALKVAQRWDVPVVGSYHTRFETYLKHYPYVAWLKAPLSRHLRNLCGACREVYVPTQSMIDALLTQGLKDNIRLWPRGVDTEQFSPAKRSARFRALYGIGEDELVIVHVSRLVREKRLDTVTRVIRQLEARGIAHRSVIVGEGPERAELAGTLPRSVFTGFLQGEELAAAYASSDVFLFASDTESFGNVTLEAMASGLPCVCANATGSRSLVLHGHTGLLAAPDNPDEFVEHVATLLRDASLRSRMGAAARERSLEYSWDDAMATIHGYYRALLRGPSP